MIPLLSENVFSDRKREPMLDYEAYYKEANDLINRIHNAAKKLGDPAWLKGKDLATLMRLTHIRAQYALDLISLSYSAGAELAALREFYPEALSHFEEYALYSEAFNETPEGRRSPAPHLAIGDFDFQRANRLLCFAILLSWQQYIRRIMVLVDYNNPVRDGMLERIASIYVERSQPFPTKCRRHLPYYKTLAIFDAPPEKRPELMRKYLEEWYEASRREPYYGSHANGPQFLGYWSWEAAAITAALQIDDSIYHDLQFYPRDLSCFRKRLNEQAKPAAPTSELRAKAGEPCPADGLWESIGFPAQQIRYTRSIPMQDLGSSYGLTVWRHLDA